jgi:hypothetical protein
LKSREVVEKLYKILNLFAVSMAFNYRFVFLIF